MKRKSLGFKLVAGGIAVVLIPLVVVGLFSVNKASKSLEGLGQRAVREHRQRPGQYDPACAQGKR